MKVVGQYVIELNARNVKGGLSREEHNAAKVNLFFELH